MSLDLLNHTSDRVDEFESDTNVLRCFECRVLPSEDFKMLPCLHLCCVSCLKVIIERSNIAMPQNGANVKCSIFSCPECAYVVRIVNGDISFLKSFIVDFSYKNNFEKQKTFNDKIKEIKIDDENEVDQSSQLHASENGESDDAKLCQFCCELSLADEEDHLFCHGCQLIVCQRCSRKHDGHETKSLQVHVGSLKKNMEKMNQEMRRKHESVKEKLKKIELTKNELIKNKEELCAEIEEKTRKLFDKIEKQKEGLLKKLKAEYKVCYENQTKSEDDLKKFQQSLENCMAFSRRVVEEDSNLVNIYSDMEAHITRTFLASHHKQVLEQLRIDSCIEAKEDQLVEKLCGSLVTGSTTFGTSRTIQHFNCGLTWPSCMLTSSEVFVVAGRSETFKNSSKLLFFSVKEHHLICSNDISEASIVDLLPLPSSSSSSSSSSDFLLSLSNGSLCKYSFNGSLSTTYKDLFEPPGGHMSTHTQQTFILSTNHLSLSVCRYSDAQVLCSIHLSIPPPSTFTPPSSELHSTTITSSNTTNSQSTTTTTTTPSLLPSEPSLIRCLSTNVKSDNICVILENNSIYFFTLNTHSFHPSSFPPSSSSSSPSSSCSSSFSASFSSSISPSSSSSSLPSIPPPPSSSSQQPSSQHHPPSSTLHPHQHHLPPFKCPSHLTVDSFGNLLISDFTHDSVSLCSGDGDFMGTLLSKPPISCPHRLMVDHDDHLYVAQFGGDISVHHYLSFIRRI